MQAQTLSLNEEFSMMTVTAFGPVVQDIIVVDVEELMHPMCRKEIMEEEDLLDQEEGLGVQNKIKLILR
jgi:hypothetical protein